MSIGYRGDVRVQTNGANPYTYTLATAWNITAISIATSAVVTISSTSNACPIGVSSQVIVNGVSGMTQINGLTGTVTATALVTNGSWNITVNINSSTFSAYSSGGTLGINVQPNDVILVCWNNGSSPATCNFPAGWNTNTSLVTQAVNGSENPTSAGMLWKIAGSNESNTYSITLNSASGQSFFGITLRYYYGVNNTTPFSVTPVTTPAVNSAAFPLTLSLNGISPNNGDTLVLFVPFSSGGTTSGFTFTQPSGFANSDLLFSTTDFMPVIASCDYINYAGGSTGPLTANATYAGSGISSGYAGFLIALASSGSSFSGFKLYANGAFYAPAFVEGGF